MTRLRRNGWGGAERRPEIRRREAGKPKRARVIPVVRLAFLVHAIRGEATPRNDLRFSHRAAPWSNIREDLDHMLPAALRELGGKGRR